jgi:hypothetical protein
LVRLKDSGGLRCGGIFRTKLVVYFYNIFYYSKSFPGSFGWIEVFCFNEEFSALQMIFKIDFVFRINIFYVHFEDCGAVGCLVNSM